MGLLLTQLGITGVWASVVGILARWLLGKFLDEGILQIDLTVASLKTALEADAYKQLAKQAYDHASARVYTEAEKEVIRQDYLAALDKFAFVGNGVRKPTNP